MRDLPIIVCVASWLAAYLVFMYQVRGHLLRTTNVNDGYERDASIGVFLIIAVLGSVFWPVLVVLGLMVWASGLTKEERE